MSVNWGGGEKKKKVWKWNGEEDRDFLPTFSILLATKKRNLILGKNWTVSFFHYPEFQFNFSLPPPSPALGPPSESPPPADGQAEHVRLGAGQAVALGVRAGAVDANQVP